MKEGKERSLVITLSAGIIICMCTSVWALGFTDGIHPDIPSGLIPSGNNTTVSIPVAEQDTSKIEAARQFAGIIRIHDTAGGGGSGSLMTGPSIYLETKEGTYPIINPTSYYADPLWQELIPLKNKEVTLTAELAPISPYSGYEGQLENVRDIKPEYYWGDIEDMDIVSRELISHLLPEEGSYREEITTCIKNKKLSVKTAHLIWVNEAISSYYSDMHLETTDEEIYLLDLISGVITNPKGEETAPTEKAEYTKEINKIISAVRRQQSIEDKNKFISEIKEQQFTENGLHEEELQKVLDYLADINKESTGSKYYWGEELPEMEIPYQESTETEISVKNDILYVTYDYNICKLDLLTGKITDSSLAVDESVFPENIGYTKKVKDMLFITLYAFWKGQEELNQDDKDNISMTASYLENILESWRTGLIEGEIKMDYMELDFTNP